MDVEVLNAAKCPHHVQKIFAYSDVAHSIPDATELVYVPNPQYWLAQ
jgi:hypothetical protein